MSRPINIICCSCGRVYPLELFVDDRRRFYTECPYYGCGSIHLVKFDAPAKDDVVKPQQPGPPEKTYEFDGQISVREIKLKNYYADYWASRIADSDRVDQSGSDEGDVTDWDVADEFIVCIMLYTGSSKDTLAEDFKLQWRNVTDSGSWTDLTGSGELVNGTGTVLTNDDYVDATEDRCTNPGGYTYDATSGVECDDGTPSVEAMTDPACTEIQIAVDPAGADPGDQYEFRLWSTTQGSAVTTPFTDNAIGSQITMKKLVTVTDTGSGSDATPDVAADVPVTESGAGSDLAVVQKTVIEDFTTYTCVEAGGSCGTDVVVTKHRVDWSAGGGITRDEDTYLYKDKGANFFSGDFDFLFDLYIDDISFLGQTFLVGVANAVEDFQNQTDAIACFIYDGPKIGIEEAGGNYDEWADSDIAYDTTYYCRFKKDHDAGANGQATLDIYGSAADREAETGALANLSINLGSKKKFRYLYAVMSIDTDHPTRITYAYVDSLVLRSLTTEVTDTGTGADAVTTLILKLIQDSGVGADAISSLTVSLTATDSGAGADQAPTIAADVLITESGAGADQTPTISVTLTVTDSGAGSDADPTVTVSISMADSAAGADLIAALEALLSLSDSGAGADSIDVDKGVILKSVSDSGTGADQTPEIEVVLTVSETGAGADQTPEIAADISVTDIGAGADQDPTVSASMTVLESGAGVDAITQIAVTLSVADSGAGADAIDVDTGAILKQVIDAALGTDGTLISVDLTVSDVGAGADLVDVIKIVFKTVSDSGLGTDAVGPITVTVQLAETATAMDAIAAIAASFKIAEAAGATDAVARYDFETQIVTITFSLSERSIEFSLEKRTMDFNLIP